MKYLGTFYTKTGHLRNDIWNELAVFLLYEIIREHWDKWKMHLQRMERTRIPLQAYKYRPSDRRDVEKGGKRRNNIRGRSRRSA
jgi:hypothetical protein